MVFSSLIFLYVFLPIVMILYYISPKRGKNIIILVSGLLFYAWGEPVYVLVMIASTLIDYTAGLIMDKFDDKIVVRRVCLIISLVMNISLLGVFKYLGFFIETLNAGFSLNIENPNLPLPIGISFFTFQSMSYTIDMYLRKIKVQKNVFSFTAFVTLFPQIVAGPIVRYEDIANEIDDRKITTDMVGEGIYRFITGLGKKVLIANNIGLLWTTVKATDYGELSALTAWLGILAFTFQIYFDFSGYSDMAIGLGKMLGFNFPENFDYPYMSRSITEFWRRWHMTLGGWFKSYIYFPLGGSRKGMARTIFNLAVVWAVTGLWHGASWNFVFWGVYFGILIILEKLFLGKLLEKIPSFFSWLYTFILVVFGWVLFEAVGANIIDDGKMFTTAFKYIGAMFGANGTLVDNSGIYLLLNYGLVMIIAVFGSTNLTARFVNYLKLKLPMWTEYGVPIVKVGVMVLSTAYLADASYNPFLYFNF